MTRTEIMDELKEIVLEYLDEVDMEVSEESLLNEDLGLTSLDMISIVGDIEDTFDIEFEDEAIDDIRTAGDVLDYIEKAIA